MPVEAAMGEVHLLHQLADAERIQALVTDLGRAALAQEWCSAAPGLVGLGDGSIARHLARV